MSKLLKLGLVLGVLLLVIGGSVYFMTQNNSGGQKYMAKSISIIPGQDETEYKFTWHAPIASTGGVIEYSQVGAKGLFSNVKLSRIRSQLSKEVEGFVENEVTVSGLKPSTEYTYRLGDGEGNWTEEKQFKTENPQEFNFLFMGDPQIGSSGNRETDAEGWRDTLKKATSMFPDSSFIQTAGDQVENADSEEEYEGFFSSEILEEMPMATTVGNHDDGQLYRYHANSPNQSGKLGETDASPGDYYFTYGNALIMNLNTNNKNTEEHARFLEETIAATENLDIKWRFVVFHHSIYSAGGHSSSYDILDLREGLVPIIDRLEIDAALMAHDHSYARTYQMKEFMPIKNQMVQNEAVINPEGTVYFTANSSSGSKYYGLSKGQEPYAAVKEQVEVPTFMNIKVTSRSLEFATYRTDTLEVTDSYKIIKDDSIEVSLPGLEEVRLDVSKSVLTKEETLLYPVPTVTIEGINTEGGPFDIPPDDIRYYTSPEDALYVDGEGKVHVNESIELGKVALWAEVRMDGQKINSEKTMLEVVNSSEEELIGTEKTWSYLDDGSKQQGEWKEQDFDDSGWKTAEGPFGYPEDEDRPTFGKVKTLLDFGEDEEQKHATTYFRTEFNIEDVGAVENIGVIEFEVDDSLILYLNGTEISRFNLPEGEIQFDEYLEDVSNENNLDESQTERIYLSKEQLKNLKDGQNVLAAEVHQSDPDSSDLYLGLKLLAD